MEELLITLSPILGPTGIVAVIAMYLWSRSQKKSSSDFEASRKDHHKRLVQMEADLANLIKTVDEMRNDIKALRKDFTQHLLKNQQ